ncbi:uncharacterized protein DEA37_0006524 [Paragonimus westermani]|uniref:Uncharacterized protein n=1 Tax=Paragonimus westermani TaxID=34504 RepID=A0A5J4N5V6_9TREM|nr:uncharacterized protein DEA37_0006524 [Paragonimus westermani]
MVWKSEVIGRLGRYFNHSSRGIKQIGGTSYYLVVCWPIRHHFTQRLVIPAAYLTFGRELRLPLELLPPTSPLEVLSLIEYVMNLCENLRTAFTLGQGHMKDAQRRQHISGSVYPVDSRVWLHRPKAGNGEPANLHRQWQGRCEAVPVHSPTVYVIRQPLPDSSNVLTVHYDQLKPASLTTRCEPYDIIVLPGCIPTVQQSAEIPPEEELAGAHTNEITEDSAPAESGQCGGTETVWDVLK